MLKARTYARWEAEDVWNPASQIRFEGQLAGLRARFDADMARAVDSLNTRLNKYREIVAIQDKIVDAQLRIQLAVSAAQRRVAEAFATEAEDLVSFAREQAEVEIEQKRLKRLAETEGEEAVHEEPLPESPEHVEPAVPTIPE